jgi:tetratricopeptide (TPR) repeat protein
MQRSLLLLAIVFHLSLSAAAQAVPPHHHEHQKVRAAGPVTVLPVTTTSVKARALYRKGMTDSMNFHLDRGLEQWRAAVKLDPNFALAHLMIAFRSQDPKEARLALERANAAAKSATRGERLFVRWITGIREGNFVSGIAAMNDLLALYPRDKQLLSLAGNWLMVRYSYDRADALCDRALEVDPDYPPALNSAAYAHAQMGEIADAIELMKHYTEVLKDEPNAQDSYAEILRMAGNYDEAIQHYQAALKMAPGFSIMGLADTYLLKGDEERAREQYLRCNEQAEMSEDKILCRLQFPITYLWEKNYRSADEGYEQAAKWAHEHELGLMEAQAHRMMAMYQEDDATALQHLDRAVAALDDHPSVSKSDREEEMSRILRARVVRALRTEDPAGSKALQQLQDLAGSNSSEIVQRSYHAALGAVLLEHRNPKEAIDHLREDIKNALSMSLLVTAYEDMGDQPMAAATRKELANLHLPTIDYAIVMAGTRSAKAAR